MKRWLEFRLAHARARDAVMTPLDEEQVRAGLAAHGLECLSLSSAVADRNEYLTRPDKGRRLSVASRQLLDAWMDAHPGSAPDVSVVICPHGPCTRTPCPSRPVFWKKRPLPGSVPHRWLW